MIDEADIPIFGGSIWAVADPVSTGWIGVVVALCGLGMKVIDYRTRNHGARIEANTKEIADLKAIIKEMARVLRIDRHWMAEASRAHNIPLPEGFAHRSFDEPTSEHVKSGDTGEFKAQ